MTTQPGKPSFSRKGSSSLSIEHNEFEWLKAYFTREPGDSTTPLPMSSPGAGKKHRLSASGGPDDPIPLVAMSPAQDAEDDDDGGTHAGKRRRKIGWTNTEDLTILAAVHRIGTQWQRIADNLPGRTSDAVRNRWHRLQKTHKLSDTDEGRSALDGLLVASGIDPDWCPPELRDVVVVGGGGGGGGVITEQQQCIRGADHGRHMWTEEEDRIIADGVKRLGCKWRQIAALLPNRTDSSVRNRWMRLCKESNSVREASLRDSLREDSLGAASHPPASDPATPPARRSSASALSSAAVPASGGPLPPTTANLQAAAALAVASGLPPSPAPLEPGASGGDSERLLEELTMGLKDAVGVSQLPLGLDAPMMVLDLDSFVEAVSACVHDQEGAMATGRDSERSGRDSIPLPDFDLDETVHLTARPPARAKTAAGAKPRSADACEAGVSGRPCVPLKLRLASAALATASGISVVSSALGRRGRW